MIESVALALVLALVTAPGAYLGLAALVSLRGWRVYSPNRGHRFAVLVPAHDEAPAIGNLLESLEAQDYPPAQVAVYVVADNCRDRTAEVARAHGAIVHERVEPLRRGKGAALNWLISRVFDEAGDADAFVFLDADSRVGRNFLATLSGALASGARAVQTRNLVEVSSGRPLNIVRSVAFHLFGDVRLSASERLGGSAGLRGNGMSLGRELVQAMSWDEMGVVEDIAFSLQLVDAGIRIAFARDAVVRSLMPDRMAEALGQTTRWERSKFDLFRPAVRLLWRALATRDRARLVTALDVLLPPSSVIVTLGLAGVVASALFGSPKLFILSSFGLISFVGYVARGVYLAKVPPAVLVRILWFVPAFVAWKLWVMLRVASGAGRGQWTRSSREDLRRAGAAPAFKAEGG